MPAPRSSTNLKRNRSTFLWSSAGVGSCFGCVAMDPPIEKDWIEDERTRYIPGTNAPHVGMDFTPKRERARDEASRALMGNEKLFSRSVHGPGSRYDGRYVGAGAAVDGSGHRIRLRFPAGMNTQRLTDFRLDLGGDVLVLLEELLGVLAALPDALGLVAEPGARLFHDVVVHRQVEHVAFAGNAFAVHDVELGFAERR